MTLMILMIPMTAIPRSRSTKAWSRWSLARTTTRAMTRPPRFTQAGTRRANRRHRARPAR
eukprot:3301652-Prymnesium_polylepis.1